MSRLLKAYDSNWVDQFNAIKSILAKSLAGVPSVIEHVGSTAIEGLSAKPIIDIDVAYSSKEDFELIENKLEEIGYTHTGDLGIPGREAFNRKKDMTNEILDRIPHNLYVCHKNNREFKRHIAFRNYLRKHKQARKGYEKLKYKIAAQTNHEYKDYVKLKGRMAQNFVEEILSRSPLLDSKDQRT